MCGTPLPTQRNKHHCLVCKLVHLHLVVSFRVRFAGVLQQSNHFRSTTNTMSTIPSTLDDNPPDEHSEDVTPSKSARSLKQPHALACVLCQQRKVKCDRKSPCTNCIKSRVQCVSASQVARKRLRRYPERELLGRLRQYEGLLRSNNIMFEPLHDRLPGENKHVHHQHENDPYDDDEEKTIERSLPSTTATSDRVDETR